MRNEKEFKEIGKKVPYQVPKDFFDTITEKTLEKAKLRNRNRKIKHLLIWTSAAASVIVILLFSGLVINQLPKVQKLETVVQGNKNNKELRREIMEDLAIAFEIEPGENYQEPVSEDISEYQDETFENLLASLTEEELQDLAGQIFAEIYFNELIEE
ncbi:MAG: hypothetical protein ACOC13_02525 [Tangfeifania sp.]